MNSSTLRWLPPPHPCYQRISQILRAHSDSNGHEETVNIFQRLRTPQLVRNQSPAWPAARAPSDLTKRSRIIAPLIGKGAKRLTAGRKLGFQPVPNISVDLKVGSSCCVTWRRQQAENAQRVLEHARNSSGSHRCPFTPHSSQIAGKSQEGVLEASQDPHLPQSGHQQQPLVPKAKKVPEEEQHAKSVVFSNLELEFG